MQEITSLDYKEKGYVHKKGVLMILAITKKEGPFEGTQEDVKVLWRKMQKYLGFHEAMGAEGVSTSDLTDPEQVLKMRLAKGKITAEEYARLKDAMNS